jgi:hypothetical protein
MVRQIGVVGYLVGIDGVQRIAAEVSPVAKPPQLLTGVLEERSIAASGAEEVADHVRDGPTGTCRGR